MPEKRYTGVQQYSANHRRKISPILDDLLPTSNITFNVQPTKIALIKKEGGGGCVPGTGRGWAPDPRIPYLECPT